MRDHAGRWGAIAALLAIVVTIGAVVVWPGPRDGWTDDSLELPGPPRDLAVAGDAAWISAGETDGEARLFRVDLANGELDAIPETTGASSVAADAAGVWVSVCARVVDVGCRGRAIARIDPSSLTVLRQVDTEGHNLELAVERGLVWASMSGPGQIDAFDAETLEWQRSVPSIGTSFTVAQDAAWGIWQMSRIPEVRMWPPSRELSLPLSTVPGEPTRVRVEDACALAVGPVTAWVVSCRPVARPDPDGSPAPGSPSGTSTSFATGTRLVVQVLGPRPEIVGSFLAPDATSPTITPMGTEVLLGWIDTRRGTLELRGIGSERAASLEESIPVEPAATGMWGPPPPAIVVAGPEASPVVYVAVVTGDGGRLLRIDG